MIIDCHQCNAKVDAEYIGQVDEEDFINTATILLRCPSCKSALVGQANETGDPDNPYSELVRVYPKPRRLLGFGIPPNLKTSIEEAEKCMQSGAYIAAAAMSGRALEALCRHYGTKETYLGAGIKELKEKGLIDARLYEWSEELRDIRNETAHATDAKVSARDAEDILSFTYAIVDYVFLLAKKFEEFKKRKGMKG